MARKLITIEVTRAEFENLISALQDAEAHFENGDYGKLAEELEIMAAPQRRNIGVYNGN